MTVAFGRPDSGGSGTLATDAELAAAVTDLIQPKPFTVGYLGDSLMPNSSWVPGSNDAWSVAWAHCGQSYAHGHLGGVSGQTSTQIAARVEDVVDEPPTICLVHAGVNDLVAAGTAATIQTNLQTIIDTLNDAGVKPVILTPVPSQWIETAAELAESRSVTDWIKTLPADQGIDVIDWRAAAVDWTSTSAAWRSGYSDGVHPTDGGMVILGRVVADYLSRYVTSPYPGLVSDAGSEASLLTLNPGMTGSGGTAGTGVTGTVPASWTVNPNSSCTVTASTVARTDGVGGNWLQLAVTNGACYLFQQNTAVGSAWNVGDTVYLEVEVLIESDVSNFRGVSASLQFWNGIGTVNDYAIMTGGGIANPILGSTRPYVLRTTPTVIPASTARLQAYIYLNQSTASATATVKLGRAAIRKA